MRVSDAQIYALANANTGSARERMVSASDKLSTGFRVRHPGDDPTAIARALHQDRAVERLQSIQENIGHATSEVNIADAAIGTVADIITRARELTVQLANDTYNAEDRAGAALEIAALTDSMTAALNQPFGDKFIFGGHETLTPPFDAAGNYAGDTGVREIEIAPGVTQAISTRADVAIKGAGGGVDVYQVLADLQAALNANDANLIRGQLSNLDTSLTQVSTARTELGNAGNVLLTAEQAHVRAIDDASAETARLIEQDFIEGGTALAQAQSALEAVLAASAKSFDLSLLDRL